MSRLVSRFPKPMTAVVKTKPQAGPKGTEIKTVPVPTPGPAEVLVRVIATAVCGSDKHIYQWDPSMASMVTPPRIYGHEFCGEIVAFGHCRPCRTGQRHICENTRILGVHGDGCFAQYVTVPAFNVVPLDRNVV